MPFKGGQASKAGACYEAVYTAMHLLNILDGKHDYIQIESTPSEKLDGIDFYAQEKDGSKKYYQVKRSNTADKWTFNKLEDKKVVSNFYSLLKKNDHATCVFASASPIPIPMKELFDRAEQAEDVADFKSRFLTGDKDEEYSKLLNILKEDEKAYLFLKKTEIDVVSIEHLKKETLPAKIKSLIIGHCDSVIDCLFQFVLYWRRSHCKDIKAEDIWNHLESRDFKKAQYYIDNSVLDKISRRNSEFKSKINKRPKFFSREKEFNLLEDYLLEDKIKIIFVTGVGGIGKSSFIYGLAEDLDDKQIPYIAISIDQIPAHQPLESYIDLPNSPHSILENIAQGKEKTGVLIIDQFDAVSLTSGKKRDFFYTIENIINEIRFYQKIKVVICCRDFDLNNDGRIKNLFTNVKIIMN